MNDITFTIFDTETTGFSPEKGDRMIEIAAMKITNGKVSEEIFETLINPERDIPYDAASVNKITPEMVASAPKLSEVLPKFLDFIAGTKLVAHNAEFDMAFLQYETTLWNPFEQLPEAFCTKLLSRSIYPQERHHNLDSISYRFGLPKPAEGRHRALTDVKLLAEIFLRLLQEGGITSIEELRAKSRA